MSEVGNTTPNPPSPTAVTEAVSTPTTQQRLLNLFERLLPVVDSVADKLRFALILGVVLVAWIFIWLYFLKSVSLGSASLVAGIALLPLLIVARFLWALEELKDLPAIADRMLDDAQGSLTATVKGLQTGTVDKVSLLGSAKKLWNIRGMAGEARELLGSYVSIGTLINPLSLMMGVLSLLFVIFLVLVSIVLLILALF